MSTRAFQQFLHSPELQRLGRQIASQRKLAADWQSVLPIGLVKLTEVVNVEGDCLIVATRSAAVAAKIRQMEARLVQQLIGKGLKINAIRCKIQVERLPHEQKQIRRGHEISAPALATLRDAAEQLPPSPLKDALAALVAKRSRRG
ncbi:DciA family protein [Chitinimonas sp. BJYL2]|uniref:DciA family protein n=1 Tax=Chitinimonas sp. BJYL2 TaxID=2976696 RepID=UPI0022B2F44C|nr:DciA family protein [Chitinimonas sp. BJYL2]